VNPREPSEPSEPDSSDGDVIGDPTNGAGIIVVTMVGTAVFILSGVLAAVFMGGFMVAYVAISLLQFAFGTVVFALAFLRAVDRSREQSIGVGGLFFGTGSMPKPVQRRLVGSLIVQVVASIAIASSYVYTALAFGVVAPMWSLGFTGLWAAAYGTFPEREFDPRLDRGRDRSPRRPGSAGTKD
jgi:hypothetical protein